LLYLHGIGHFHPEAELDNAFLVSLDIGVDESWILRRLGIRTRRTVLDRDYIRHTKNQDPRAANEASLYTNAQTGSLAATLALQSAGLTAADIGLVINGGCSPQWFIPAEACVISSALGIEAPAFDLNSACATFAVQVKFLDAMETASLPDFVLLTQVENNTRTIDYRDPRSAAIWGDCSTALIVSKSIPSGITIEGFPPMSCPAKWHAVRVPVSGHFAQDGPAVHAFAIRTMHALVRDIRRSSGLDDVYFIGHQANLPALMAVCEKAEIPSERHLFNIEKFGNCGAAGAPSVLSQHLRTLKSGDSVVIAVVGSGLTWGGLCVRMVCEPALNDGVRWESTGVGEPSTLNGIGEICTAGIRP